MSEWGLVSGVCTMTMDSAPKSTSGGAPSLHDTIDKLKLSADEAGKFEKAFKDPKFLELFEQYAKDMQDPESRAETNAYLQQLERDGQIEQVYGKGTQLITPVPEFVVKGKEEFSEKKVFLNICSSEKVRLQQPTIHEDTMHLSRHVLKYGEYDECAWEPNLTSSMCGLTRMAMPNGQDMSNQALLPQPV